MAFLFVDSLNQNNSRVLQKSVKALELLLLSAGLISTLVMVKSALLPYSCEIVFSSLMGFWNSIKCLLSSHLYICIIINFMVVLIAASSTSHHFQIDNQDDHHQIKVINFDDHDLQIVETPVVSPPPRPPDATTEIITPPSPRTNISNVDAPHTWPNSTEQNCRENISTLSSPAALFLYEAQAIKKTAYSLNSSPDSSEPIKEKEHKMIINRSDDKQNNEEDTMESTWRSITGGGKQRPKKKHLKKCETWDVPPQNNISVQRLDQEDLLPSTPKWKELRKSETFNDTVSITCRGGLRRDPSTSLEEFNKQVEAFIKKFNDDMKLQRQESDQRVLDMVKRGL